MAMVSGALRKYLAANDELPDRSLMAFCPISVRISGAAGQAGQANLFGLELCTLGTDSDDPAERLAAIHRSMEWAKQQVADHGSTVSTLLAVPSIVPSLLQSVIPFSPKWRTGYNVPISNIRGPAETLYFNGARLETLLPDLDGLRRPRPQHHGGIRMRESSHSVTLPAAMWCPTSRR